MNFANMTDKQIREEIEELLSVKLRHGSSLKRLRDNRIIHLWEELDNREARTVTVYIA